MDTIERSDGSRSTREIAAHPGAVAVLAIDADDRVLLVRQFRVAVGELLLEVPAGTLDVADDGTIEDPDVASRRELEEETGMRAGSWRKIGQFYTAPGFTSELMHLYLATDLRPAEGDRLGPEEDERLLVERIPIADAIVAAQRGDFHDAKSLVALLWLARERGGVPFPARLPTPEPMSDEGALTITYRLARGELIRGGATLGRRSWATRATGVIVLILGLWPLPGVLTGDNPLSLVALAPMTVLGVLFLTGAFNAAVTWYQARKRPELFESPQSLTADDRGMTFSGSFASGFVSWATYRRVTENPELFFFDTGAGSVVMVAKSGFTDDQMRRFRGLLAKHRLIASGTLLP